MTRHSGGSVRRHSGSGGGSMIPGVSQNQLYDAGGAAFYGWLERQMRGGSDANATVVGILQKLPTPVPQLGFCGHICVYAYLAAKYGPAEIRKYARHLFNGTFDIFAYQLMAKGGLFESGNELFQISGLKATPIDVTQEEVDHMAGLHHEEVNEDNV